MRTSSLRAARLGIGLLGVTLVAVATAVPVGAPAAAAPFSVLVFSKTAGFRHDSIPTGIAAIQQLGAGNGFTVEATEDAGAFTDANLARFAAVVWLSTTGDVLDGTQQAAFERYLRSGRGYVGVHAAADTEYDWAWYGGLVGAYFSSHPAIQQATIRVQDSTHPATRELPTTWVRTDEWYSYRTNPRPAVQVLATLDESTYSGGTMGADHPISWYHDYDGGRAFYTGLGHTQASYAETAFRSHLLGGIQYAAGSQPPATGTFQQVTMARGVAQLGEPMTMAVLPDRSVLHTSRDGTVRLTTAAGVTTVAGRVPVYSHDEEGMQGIAVDPAFSTNRRIYLYYAPPLSTPAGDAPGDGTAASFAPWNGVNRLSGFTLGTNGQLDPASERIVLEVPTSRGLCCHVGGDIDFDAAGNLYLTTGDDSNPFTSDGYSPLDERAGRNPGFDAQRSAGNTNDLRGKLLRIRPNAAGGYSVPAGNLFAPGTTGTRPEIYAMGFRNPFRMSVDRGTGVVYLGDYGPDAGAANANRGPGGKVEFDRITSPGNYGWPYCIGNNEPYRDFDFGTGASGPAFDCAGGPTNNSPNNTGQARLPAARPAWITYDGGSVPEFGNGSESPMAGPVYRYDAGLNSAVKFPAAYDGHFFAGEFGRRWIKDITLNASGGVASIAPFPWTGTQVMDMAFGPDGALYVLDYGTGWFNGDEASALYRIEFVTGNRSPVARAAANRTNGPAPLAVQFSSAGSSDPDGQALTYRWVFGDGGTSTAANPAHTYTANGRYTATLTVTDTGGATGTASVVLDVGNTAPTVRVDLPVNGTVFNFGDAVPYRITVTDPEDGTINCARVTLSFILGHDAHGHPATSATGCQGTLQTPVDGEHDPNANLFGVWDAAYTDGGGLTTHAQNVTQPATRQAEHFTSQSGVQPADHVAAHGGRTVGFIENGDWIAFTPYNLAGVTSFTARVSSAGAGGTLTLRADSATGPVVGSAAVPVTGSWETFVNITGTVTVAAGTRPLYLVFTGGAGSLYDLDDFTFTRGGGTGPALLSQGRPTTTSSVEGAGFPGGNAVDGNATTRWSSAFSDPQWISVDLGSQRTVNRARLSWEGAYSRAYQLQVSADGASWRDVFATTTGAGGVDDLTIAATNARYVRVLGTARATVWGYSLFEFEVYGT